VRANERLTAFLGLEAAIDSASRWLRHSHSSAILAMESVTLRADEKLTALLELESAIRATK